MGEWTLIDMDGMHPPPAELHATDLLLLWLMGRPLDTDPAVAARRLVAVAPAPSRDTPRGWHLCALLSETAQTARTA